MGEKRHAMLSPSGASRWMACTPSAVLEYDLPDRESEAAKEGTAAHNLAEIMLKHFTGSLSESEFKKQLSEARKSPYYNAEMESLVTDYTNYVLNLYKESLNDCDDPIIEIESKLPLIYYDTTDKGTGDAVIIADNTLRVIDLKYGKGVKVDAVENKQMLIYAIGALDKYGILYDIETIEMTVYQPRMNNISTWSIGREDLFSWYEDELIPKAKLAKDGKGDFVTGEHCRFCKIRETCRAYAEHNLEVLKHDFAEPATLTDDEIADILEKSADIMSWLRAVESFATTKALSGDVLKGFKLVSGRSNRRYKDVALVADRLIQNGYPEALIYDRSLLGITAMERAITKKAFNEILGDLVIKPEGKPVLVPESDKRPAINTLQSAINDFQ